MLDNTGAVGYNELNRKFLKGIIMAVYWIFLVLTAAAGIPLCGLCGRKSDKSVAVFCGVFTMVMVVLSSIRLSVGYDYNMYAMLFYNLNFMDYTEVGNIQREMGMLFPVKVIEKLTYDYVPIFVVMSIAMYPPIGHYLRKYSDCPWVGAVAFLGLGMFFNSLNFSRQFFAAIICAYAFRYAEKKNFFRFFVLTLLAACFHRSAFMVIPCYLFCFISMNRFVLVLALMTSCSAFLLSNEVLEWVTTYVYKGYDLTSNVEIVKGLPSMYCVMYGVVFFIAFLFRNKISGTEREKNILLWCGYGAFFFELIGVKHGIVSRVALLFFIPLSLRLIPKVWCAVCELIRAKLDEKKAKAAVICLTAVVMAAFGGIYNGLLERNYNGVVPFRTIAEREASMDDQ